MRSTAIKSRYPSTTLGRMVDCESTIERSTAQVLEFATSVVTYQEQPLTIDYLDGDKLRKYTPDFRAELSDGRTLIIECKPARRVQREDVQRKAQAGQEWGRVNDATYLIVTDDDLRRGYTLKNIQTLEQFGKYAVSAETIRHIQHAVAILQAKYDPLPMWRVMCAINSTHPQMVKIPLLYAAYHHHIALDIYSAPINDLTTVTGKIAQGELITWLTNSLLAKN